jgi:ornithine carbamoyltransferase
MQKNILSILDVRDEIQEIINLGIQLKKDIKQGKECEYLKDKTLGLIFERASTRTRVSFEVGMHLLGGHSIFLSRNDLQLGRGETIEDTALVLSRYLDIIMYRAVKSDDLHAFARYATVPVINGLDRYEHPCQILADLMTIQEHKGHLDNLTFTFIGDGGDNLTNSYLLGCTAIGMNITVISPPNYQPAVKYIKQAHNIAEQKHRQVTITDNLDAVANSDVVATDTWVSLWDEPQRDARIPAFKRYTITTDIMRKAKSDALFLHCMPIYYDQEVTYDVAHGSQSGILDEAENRMWAQMALMVTLLC